MEVGSGSRPPVVGPSELHQSRVCQWVIIWKFYLCVVEFGSLDQAPLLLDLRFKWAGVESSSIELESSRAQLSWSRVELHRSRASSSTVQIQCICGGSARGEFQCHGVRSCNKKIFTRVRGRRCNSSSNAAGFCMLFCYLGDLSGMLEYHAIGDILCSAFT